MIFLLNENTHMGIVRTSRKTFRKEFVVPLLTRLFDELEDVRLAVVFGSLVKNGVTTRDIDIAIKLNQKSSLLELGNVVARVAKAFNVNEEIIDIVDVDRANPLLLLKVLKEGVVVKGSNEDLKYLEEKAFLYPDALVELREWGTLDPNPKPDRSILSSRVEEIRRNSHFLKEEILSRNVSELSYRELLMLERAMHRIIEAMLDVCRHLVSVYSLGLAESYGEYAWKLAKGGKMPYDLAEDIAKLAGLRNILVHRYLEVETRKLYDAAKEVMDRIATRFIKWVQNINC
jgi:uncharacterized protein YutE (UPF0331/DUF86 family)/predicted nucleotidyltransferase